MTAYAPQSSADAGQRDLHLRILATTDLHSCLLPYDYCSDQALKDQGLSQTAFLISEARSEVLNSVLLDNGDFLQGNPMADYMAGRPRLRGPHPVIAAFNALGYDAATLGNHEFDFGLPFLHRVLEGATFPVVSANLVVSKGADPGSDAPFVPPFALLDRLFVDEAGAAQPLRIGVIGFGPPQTMMWNRHLLEGKFAARDILEAADHWVPALRTAGAQVVIALSHSGIGAVEGQPGMENASTALACHPGIDAVIAGHSHLAFPSVLHRTAPGIDPILGELAGKPAVMPGHSGGQLGVIDLVLRKSAGQWAPVAHSVELRHLAHLPKPLPRAAHPVSAPVRRAAQYAHRATRAWAKQPIGKSARALSTYFALIAPSAAMRLIAQAQRDFVAAAVQGTAEAGLPILSAVAPFKAGGRAGAANYTHIPAGPLALRDIANLYAFPNDIAALRITGAELALWLERSACQYAHIPPGSHDLPLLDPEFPSFNCDQIDGICYKIDLTIPPRFSAEGALLNDTRRIRNLTWQGKPFRDDMPLLLATNSYRISGAGGFPGTSGENALALPPARSRDVLMRFVANRACEPDVVAGRTDAQWRLTAAPGTTVVFDSHPDAAGYLDLVPGLTLSPVGLTEGGFQRFRLHL